MAKVAFEMDGIATDVEKGEKIVDVARKAGSSIPFGCTNGICGTCIVKVIEGTDQLNPKDPDEEMTLEMFGADKPEHRLACQCIVNGNVTIDNP